MNDFAWQRDNTWITECRAAWTRDTNTNDNHCLPTNLRRYVNFIHTIIADLTTKISYTASCYVLISLESQEYLGASPLYIYRPRTHSHGGIGAKLEYILTPSFPSYLPPTHRQFWTELREFATLALTKCNGGRCGSSRCHSLQVPVVITARHMNK